MDINTYSILTTVPNELVREVHPDRMPVILDPADYEAWLTGSTDEANELLGPFPTERMCIVRRGEGVNENA